MERREVLIGGMEGYVATSDGRLFNPSGKEVTVQASGQVSYGRGGRWKSIGMAKVIATTFILNPGRCNYVRHIDGDKFNFEASNLEWSKNKVRNNARYARIIEIVALHNEGLGYSEIARKLFVPVQDVIACIERHEQAQAAIWYAMKD